jgi:predicted AAA+ superfamily ATPase
MIVRDIISQLIQAAKEFAAVALVGPRQSGKTTLAQHIFPNHAYVSLEDFDMRELANTDPRRFLQDYANEFGIILDEIQHAPKLLSYIQTIIDREKKKGYFIITGSQNLNVNEAITQTLAGRIATLTLLPLSIHELQQSNLLSSSIEEVVVKGFYPKIYAEEVSVLRLYKNYVHNYIERDVREIKQISDLNLFQKFVALCAGRTGQILNLSSLANDCGIDHKTARAWISILEATYVVFLLYPYYKNFGKRLIKSPKLYFVDTGIACFLLGIKTAEDLSNHYLRGGLIESCIIADFYKQYYNLDQKPTIYFWRDLTGNEIDCILESALHLTAVEIKGGRTVNSDFFKAFGYLKQLKSMPELRNVVVYGGSDNQRWPDAHVLTWQSAGNLIEQHEKR